MVSTLEYALGHGNEARTHSSQQSAPPVCLLFVCAITIVTCSSTPARNVDTIMFGQSESCIQSFDPQGSELN